MKIKNICCIGAGYVGGPTMAVIALKCPELKITVVDIDPSKISRWNSEDLNSLPVFEPGLAEIISKTRNKNLFFSTEIDKTIEKSEMIFMAVNTPTKKFGEGKGMAADLTYIESSALQIANASKSDKIIIEKSTLPVRTAEKIKEVLESNNKHNVKFEILSNPEFLAEGTAINDLFKSDRVLIGGDNTKSGLKAIKLLKSIYLKWVPEEKILTTNVWSSELSKLVSNAILAQRISSINSISALCEKSGADINEVSLAVGMDSRIGKRFLNSSIGFGGSCFKKDILNLVYIAKHYNLNEVADYWQKVLDINIYQTNRFASKINEVLNSTLSNKTITILGWAFKKDTNDSRESASIYLSKELLIEGASIKIYDPMVSSRQIKTDLVNLFNELEYDKNKIDFLLNNISIMKNPYDACTDSNLVAICTEWNEFTDIKWNKVFKIMKNPSWIFDGRNILDEKLLKQIGFKTYFIGRS